MVTGHQPENSTGRTKYRVVRLRSSELKNRNDVFGLKIRVVFQNFVMRCTRREKFEDILDAYA
jgi:hypothetical protein